MIRRALASAVLGALCLSAAPAARGAADQNPIRPAEPPGTASSAPDPVPTPEQAAEVARLILQLGDAKFETRDAAFKRLLDIGRPALAGLRRAERSGDPEVATAAAGLLGLIAKGVQSGEHLKALAEAGGDPAPAPELALEIKRRIAELGSERFEAREAAGKRLQEIGRPALAALREAAKARDAEVASRAGKLAEDIANNIRASVRIKVLRPTDAGEREVILESEALSVTVRESRQEFTTAVICSAPTRAEFQAKFPGLWKRWAEPALDASDPDKLAVEAMVRQLLPQIIAAFSKQYGREPTLEEKAEAEKLLREETRKALDANRAKAAGKADAPKP
jgi:hypothetical protein